MSEKIKLQTILNDFEAKKWVLPDFQRKFEWEIDDMYSLYASVLCRNPIGSILTLESLDDEFACKKIGAKPRTCKAFVQEGQVTTYLIDGQQRLTSLLAGFSTYYFTEFKNNPENIAAKRLLSLYFLKIPAENNSDIPDLFSAHKLEFDSNRYTNDDDLYFLSNEMLSLITSESVSKIVKKSKYEIFDINDKESLDDIASYCCNNSDGFYKIPLQFILSSQGKIPSTYRKILKKIADSFINEADGNEDKCEDWIENVKSYLSTCLLELQLKNIKVPNSDKSRAIDIYSNLNKNGVILSVFDLIMARVGTKSKENFYDTLVGYILEDKNYPEELLKQKYICLDLNSNYNASKLAEIVNEKNVITTDYINRFLNVLSLYITKQDNLEINKDVIKQDKKLKLDPDKIIKTAHQVCLGLDRALMFFQTRCGVRKLSDLNYKLQFDVIAYFFTNDDYFKDLRIHNFFEFWYWISIFGCMYPSNQNALIFAEISKFDNFFTNNLQYSDSLFEYLKSYRTQVLKVPHYSNAETLTMVNSKSTEKAPLPVMTKYICQYYLSKGYKDFFNNTIEINSLYKDKLPVHHIMPLGSSDDKKIGVKTEELRNDKYHMLNSPLNMLYITTKSNTDISDMYYSKYSKDDRVINVIANLGCLTGFDCSPEEFLKNRFNSLSADLTKRLDLLEKTFKTE